MSPITHYLASWALAAFSPLQKRDIAVVTWAGTLPDMDGAGIVIDIANRIFGTNESHFYGQYHHQLLHGFFGALILSSLATVFSSQKKKVFLLSFLAVHLHLLFDLVGSRGVAPDDIWPIPYFVPWSTALNLSWAYQWPLNGWQNALITLFLLLLMFYQTIRNKNSALAPISTAAHKAFVEAVQGRWNRVFKKGRR